MCDFIPRFESLFCFWELDQVTLDQSLSLFITYSTGYLLGGQNEEGESDVVSSFGSPLGRRAGYMYLNKLLFFKKTWIIMLV